MILQSGKLKSDFKNHRLFSLLPNVSEIAPRIYSDVSKSDQWIKMLPNKQFRFQDRNETGNWQKLQILS